MVILRLRFLRVFHEGTAKSLLGSVHTKRGYISIDSVVYHIFPLLLDLELIRTITFQEETYSNSVSSIFYNSAWKGIHIYRLEMNQLPNAVGESVKIVEKGSIYRKSHGWSLLGFSWCGTYRLHETRVNHHRNV